MTSAPLYDFSVVPFTRSIKNLLAILDKAEKHAREAGDNIEDYIQLQIHPDMKKYVPRAPYLQCVDAAHDPDHSLQLRLPNPTDI